MVEQCYWCDEDIWMDDLGNYFHTNEFIVDHDAEPVVSSTWSDELSFDDIDLGPLECE